MEQRRPARRNWLLVLDGLADPVSRSRDFTHRALTAWHWLPAATAEGRQAAEDVVLLVSEVVANACLHGGGAGALVLDCTPERLRIEVTDINPAPPVPAGSGGGRRRSAGAGWPGGYGLLIVDRLAREWGSRPGAAGKCVWLEVPCPPGTRCPPAGRDRAGFSGGSPARR
ncbi:ATP-binding protein [Streptomyces racemochromogenes]|uniref:ATP-binding protein n=1 Tax=Streptomyces racemochromogenes TaxID=67353 RepID=A0ABW7PKJ0_9ACTN